MSKDELRFTVFTATYNRAHTLDRVYHSLSKQTFRDFEWLIVDDGSTDNTAEIVKGWQQEAGFEIRYLHKPNGGKHTAWNLGVKSARGTLFLSVDSDDECVPTALERFDYHWRQIPESEIHRYSAVTALCVNEKGELVGTKFPKDVFDSDSREIRYVHHVKGDNFGCQRTAVMREHPFPEDHQQCLLPEGLLWNKIARLYKTRYINEVLRVYYTDQPSLASHVHPKKHALGRTLLHASILNNDIAYLRHSPKHFFKSAAQFSRSSFHSGVGPFQQVKKLENPQARLLWAVAMPIAYVVAKIDDRK